ncbi:MAG TPA: acyl-ACP thioesterase domain-containing protein [Solirubrobacteraceae bacterium]|jgi:acyl-ACP thioesterase|nr:acyl-ACP thioesterase domain-containing protein [Solirubrobacteraceae bacterium]
MSGDHDHMPARHANGRAFEQGRQPGFADCAPSGRVRLDALACWLQDIAYLDVQDAGLEHAAVWVVRRTRIRVNRFPRFGERFSLTTFCSGLGRMWAERRTDIVHADDGASRQPDVQAVSLWVHLDAEHWRPSPLTAAELETYGGAPPSRRVTARLRHPAPAAVTDGAPWTFRATDCDIADHVNNAVYWQPLEEELLTGGAPDPERLDVEIEYRTPAQPGGKRVLCDGDFRWIVGEDGELHASIRLGADGG